MPILHWLPKSGREWRRLHARPPRSAPDQALVRLWVSTRGGHYNREPSGKGPLPVILGFHGANRDDATQANYSELEEPLKARAAELSQYRELRPRRWKIEKPPGPTRNPRTINTTPRMIWP